MVKITFNDNTIINVEKNGNNYIVDNKPNFPADLTNITIEEEQQITGIIKNGIIAECFPLDNRYWFTIIEKPESEVMREQILDLECIISDLLEMM